jgi:hypothetical protein
MNGDLVFGSNRLQSGFILVYGMLHNKIIVQSKKRFYQ